MIEVNDVQSQINQTSVQRIIRPTHLSDIEAALAEAKAEGRSLCMAGGRHAMGGQQFAEGAVMLDMRSFDRVVDLDRVSGLVEVESGIMWPALIDHLHACQANDPAPWAIRQKQTGVDSVTIGGSLAANIHGRGLSWAPFAADIDSFRLLNANSDLLTCSRSENAELFSLAIGGYGLFGVVTHVTLRLMRRIKLKRLVECIAVRGLMPRVEEWKEDGCLFGDCQYSICLENDEEFHPGIFSCYKPVDDHAPIKESNKQLSSDDWAALYALSRTNKTQAFDQYTHHYLGTSGQHYWSDTHQLSSVFEGYKDAVDPAKGTEMITEVYVSADNLIPFLVDARRDLIEHQVDMTYGTIRFIEKDEDTFLPWATKQSVCIVCNLHITHDPEGLRKARADFRRILDRVLEYKGRFYLTYHRWATADQIQAAYPQFPEFLKKKKFYDPGVLFQSNWYRQYNEAFA